MKITRDTLQKIAHLARLEIEPSEEEELMKDMGKIVTWIEKLDELDLNESSPEYSLPARPLETQREDKDDHEISRENAMKNAPQKKDGFFVVPNIMEKKK